MNASEVRAHLGHPVIDGDGHWREPLPVFFEYLAEEAGSAMVERYKDWPRDARRWYELDAFDRQACRQMRPGFWGEPIEARDRVTSIVPGMMYDRLDELGFDFATIYTTIGFQISVLLDDDLRHASTRALNRMNRDAFAPYADRLTSVAVVPLVDPREAVELARHAVLELGFKAIMVTGTVPRRRTLGPEDFYGDTVGLDSPYDYEPFWDTCSELQVAVTDHGGSIGWPMLSSPTNYTFNHLGHFATGLHTTCKALVLGGVPHRHPNLSFAFLEGGVGWANNLVGDLIGHFEKRNIGAIEHQRPTNLDLEEVKDLYRKFAVGRLAKHAEEILGTIDTTGAREQECLDDFAASGITSGGDICSLFETNFYFGCEPDDPMTVFAFDDRMPARLKPFFSSDISHFDVMVMADALPEAWEMVEAGKITERDFEEFTFRNVVKLHTSANPHFYEGTVVETEVAAVISEGAEIRGT